MIERLLNALTLAEALPPEIQDQLAQEIEELAEPRVHAPIKSIAGLWRDLPDDDDEFAALDQIRHGSPPSPFLDEE